MILLFVQARNILTYLFSPKFIIIQLLLNLYYYEIIHYSSVRKNKRYHRYLDVMSTCNRISYFRVVKRLFSKRLFADGRY